MIGAITSFFFSFFSFPFGRFSDRKGRKNVVLIGTGGLAVSSLIFLSSSNFGQIFIVSAILGVFVGAWFPIIGAIAADADADADIHNHTRGYVMGIYSAVISAAYTASPFISLFLLDFFHYDFFFPFFACSLAAMVASLLIVTGLKKDKDKSKNFSVRQKLLPKIKKTKQKSCRNLLFSISAAFFYGFFVTTLFVFFPVFGKSLGASATEIGFLLMLFSLVRTFTFGGMGKIMEKINKEWLIITGIFGGSVLMYFVGIFANLHQFLVLFFLSGLAIGLVYPSALTIAASGEYKGRAIGAYEAALGTGTFVSPLIGGFLAELNPSSPYFLCSFVGMGISVVLLIFVGTLFMKGIVKVFI
jgi:MFS family permease